MTPEENNILDLKTRQLDRRRSSAGYPFKTLDEMAQDTPAKNWLIKGVLAKGETSAWIAPPGGMKSALLAQASVRVAAGLEWQGKPNKGAGGVVYFALERADLVEKRIRAHCLRLGLKSLPIAVVAATFDLIRPDSVKRAIRSKQCTGFWNVISHELAGSPNKQSSTLRTQREQSLQTSCKPARRTLFARMENAMRSNNINGAPRPMKMGTIVSPWRYDVMADCALQSANLRQPVPSRHASWASGFSTLQDGEGRPVIAALPINPGIDAM